MSWLEILAQVVDIKTRVCHTFTLSGIVLFLPLARIITVLYSKHFDLIAINSSICIQITWLDVRSGLATIQTEQFHFEINEFAWKPTGDVFLLATGLESVLVYRFACFHITFFFRHSHTMQLNFIFLGLFSSGKPGDLRKDTSIQAHPVNAMCLQFSPSGQYFAVGSADALVSIWDADEFVCLRTLARLVVCSLLPLCCHFLLFDNIFF